MIIKFINTVYFNQDMTAEDVYTSLVNHDNYPTDIQVLLKGEPNMTNEQLTNYIKEQKLSAHQKAERNFQEAQDNRDNLPDYEYHMRGYEYHTGREIAYRDVLEVMEKNQ